MGYDFSRMVSVLKNSAKIASRVCMAAKKLRLLKIQTVTPLLPMVLSPELVSGIFLSIGCLNN